MYLVKTSVKVNTYLSTCTMFSWLPYVASVVKVRTAKKVSTFRVVKKMRTQCRLVEIHREFYGSIYGVLQK